MKNKKIILLAAGICLIVAALLWPQQRVTLQIREGLAAYPLAIPPFVVLENSGEQDDSGEAEAAAKELHDVVLSNLKYSRIFQPVPDSHYSYIRPLDPANILFKEWESIQAQILFAGTVSKEGNGNLLFNGELYDIKAGERITGKRYTGDNSLLRLMAHRMSDEVVKMFGETPFFQTKIAFISNRDGNWELYMMDYDGYNQTRLTYNETQDYMPAWSADGRKIAYTAYRGGEAALWLYSIYEGTRTLIFDRGTSFSPSFSPDGKKLAFSTTEEDGNTQIYVARLSDTDPVKVTEVRKLTFTKANDLAPSWSPTSRQIAFTSDRSGSPQIYVMDAEGSNIERVSFGGSYFDGPAWSPTGDMIVYVSRVNNIFDIYVLNLKTNRVIKLTESNARNESPTWAPDSRHIVFASNLSGTVQLWSIDTDGTNLRRLTSTGENILPEWSR
jgi:TolB protein